MSVTGTLIHPEASPASAPRAALYPLAFSTTRPRPGTQAYLDNASAWKLVEFFERKGLSALKDEDQREQWYEDWLSYQAEHRLYASVLSPKQFSSLGHELNLLTLTRFIELFAYFSPGHGYSLQVSFLGLFSILMGTNAALKQEAVAALEAGGVFAFGVSEKDHGSDLLANELTVREVASGQYLANGSKYYIGNANAATIISVLATKLDQSGARRDKRAPLALFALRPKQARGFGNLRKIRTLGVRAGFVGSFELKDHELPQADLIAEGRAAWDSVFGTVTLGKFFLGFASVGICEHAMEEAIAHLNRRILFGKPAIQMPHLRSAMSQAYARLTAMKLFAYRALDYVQGASGADRRYLLFNAVQKAKLSTDGVRVMDLLSECMGAKGMEADTFMEMAVRDAQLIPAVEGSTHVNLGLTAQFIPRYFARPDDTMAEPPSLVAGAAAAAENPYLMEARTGALHSIAFAPYLQAYEPLLNVPNVRTFARQAKAFRLFAWAVRPNRGDTAELEVVLLMGQCLATIAYGQLIAENARLAGVPTPMISAIFHLLVGDLSATALTMAALPRLDGMRRLLIRRVVSVPTTTSADWDAVAERVNRSEGLA
jgi:acyl-CoA dehydrogenase